MPPSRASRITPSRIVSNTRVGPGWYVLRLEEPTLALTSKPGQFVQIRCREGESFDPLLRRPFSVYRVDRERATYDILYTTVGRGTRWMEALPDGPEESGHRTVDVEGPFGNTFTLPGSDDSVYLVGGGVGVAPLYFLADAILAATKPPRITLCMGARTREQLQGIEDFRKLPLRAVTATDDGSEGYHGRVTELCAKLIDEEPEPGRIKIYGCGPQGMNESLRALSTTKSLHCEICLEALMACGFGVCFGCVLPIRKEVEGDFYNRRTCWEGPVFDARLLYPGIEG
jgi:dihydroorotate dehydrogenase electron transfer subunit